MCAISTLHVVEWHGSVVVVRYAGVVDSLQPRDPSQAAGVVALMCVVAAAVTLLFSVVAWQDGSAEGAEVAITSAVTVPVIVAGWFARRLRPQDRLAWAAFPIVAILAILVLDLATADASLSAQVFLFFPALYGASQLKRTGGALLAGAAVATCAIVSFALLDAAAAVTQTGFVAATLLTATSLLIRSGERQDALIARLEEQAAVDSLTGLVTRRVLDEAARSALSGAASGDGTALILVDVDEFKSVNDRHGHPGGDDVLVQFAALLVARTRRGDIVSRLGGDEIAILLPACTESALEQRAEQILAEVRGNRFLTAEGERVAVSVSVGIAHAPTHAADLRGLYTVADAALYTAKRSGRDRVVQPVPSQQTGT